MGLFGDIVTKRRQKRPTEIGALLLAPEMLVPISRRRDVGYRSKRYQGCFHDPETHRLKFRVEKCCVKVSLRVGSVSVHAVLLTAYQPIDHVILYLVFPMHVRQASILVPNSHSFPSSHASFPLGSYVAVTECIL